jgi:hypothetical protein
MNNISNSNTIPALNWEPAMFSKVPKGMLERLSGEENKGRFARKGSLTSVRRNLKIIT